MFKSLFQPNIHCKELDKVISKMTRIKLDGISLLHFISDFDMTLTRYYESPLKRSVSSHGIMARSSVPSPEFKSKNDEYYNYYYPIEISLTVSHDEKVRAMHDWTLKANQLITLSNFTRKDIEQMVQQVAVTFRPGAQDFCQSLSKHSIPLLVFSAGLGDVIHEIMRQHNMLVPDLHIVSNMMLFDDRGTVVGFKEPLIHIFNKNETSIQGEDYFNVIKHRKNVILLGDSLGDPHMGAGLEHETTLKIGYLNHDEDELMEKYLDAYDVVITGDPPMDFVNGLLRILFE